MTDEDRRFYDLAQVRKIIKREKGRSQSPLKQQHAALSPSYTRISHNKWSKEYQALQIIIMVHTFHSMQYNGVRGKGIVENGRWGAEVVV